MSPKTLSRLLQLSVVATAACALFILLFVVPSFGEGIVTQNRQIADWYWPWLSFIWLTAVPCFAILVLIWRVSGAVRRDEVFTVKTAKLIKAGAVILFADVGFFFAGNIVLFILKMSHPAVLL
ncbi:MAG: DUF2975 domain-containing protein, partial [Oscillospiraceae bacterium]|nr:DUF2975 domain-containing protein [Oscillospiraceae bacterium]